MAFPADFPALLPSVGVWGCDDQRPDPVGGGTFLFPRTIFGEWNPSKCERGTHAFNYFGRSLDWIVQL